MVDPHVIAHPGICAHAPRSPNAVWPWSTEPVKLGVKNKRWLEHLRPRPASFRPQKMASYLGQLRPQPGDLALLALLHHAEDVVEGWMLVWRRAQLLFGRDSARDPAKGEATHGDVTAEESVVYIFLGGRPRVAPGGNYVVPSCVIGERASPPVYRTDPDVPLPIPRCVLRVDVVRRVPSGLSQPRPASAVLLPRTPCIHLPCTRPLALPLPSPRPLPCVSVSC